MKNKQLEPVFADVTIQKLVGWRGNCDVCGAVFLAPRNDAKYCGQNCRSRAYHERKKLAAYGS